MVIHNLINIHKLIIIHESTLFEILPGGNTEHVFHFDVDRALKVKSKISICTGIMLNDHSNPYIESTTALS